MGFFLFNVLDGFVPLARLKGDETFAARCEAALAEVDELAGELDGYRLYHALRAGLLDKMGRTEEATAANERALALAANPAERELLARRLSF